MGILQTLLKYVNNSRLLKRFTGWGLVQIAVETDLIVRFIIIREGEDMLEMVTAMGATEREEGAGEVGEEKAMEMILMMKEMERIGRTTSLAPAEGEQKMMMLKLDPMQICKHNVMYSVGSLIAIVDMHA